MADSEASSGLIQVFCQACGKRLVFASGLVGRRARCLGCAHIFRIPEVAKTIDPDTDDPELAGLLKQHAAKSASTGLLGNQALQSDPPEAVNHAPASDPAGDIQHTPGKAPVPAGRTKRPAAEQAHKKAAARSAGRLKQKPVDKRIRYPDVKPEEDGSLLGAGDAAGARDGRRSGSGSGMAAALPSSSGVHDALNEDIPQAPTKSGALLVIEGILYLGCIAVVLVLLFWFVHWSLALWILLPVIAVYGRSLGVRMTFLLTGGLVSPSA